MDVVTKNFVLDFINKKKNENNTNLSILEVGSKDVNGSIRSLFTDTLDIEVYHGVDMEDGESVDFVGHLCEEKISERLNSEYDIVLCLNVLEHDRLWRRTFDAILNYTKQGGNLLLIQPSLIKLSTLNFINCKARNVNPSFLLFSDISTEDGEYKGNQFQTEFPRNYEVQNKLIEQDEKDRGLSSYLHNSLLPHSKPASSHFSVNYSTHLSHNIHFDGDETYYSNVELGSMLELMALTDNLNKFDLEIKLNLECGIQYSLNLKRLVR